MEPAGKRITGSGSKPKMSDKTAPFYLAAFAGISGLFLGLAALALGLVFPWKHPWAIAGVTFALVGAGAWLGLLAWWRSVVERIHKIERPVPSAEPYQFTTRLTVVTGVNNSEGVYLDIPVDRERLFEVAAKLAAGCEFSHASLAGRYRPLSRSEYEALRDALLARGLVRWKDARSHNLGLELSRAGAAAMRQLVRLDQAQSFPALLAGTEQEVTEN